MLRHDTILPIGQPNTMKPHDTPPQDEQSQYKSNPALFALALSDHSAFETVADNAMRVMTPPPEYSRLEPPRRLTLMIPETTIDQNISSTSPNSQFLPDIPIVQSTTSSPVEISPSQETEGKFFNKVKAGMRKRREGISRRLRRTSSGSKSTSASTSPQETTTTPPWSPNGGEMAELVIQELDSHEIESPTIPNHQSSREVTPDQYRSSHFEWQRTLENQRIQRQTSFSSIMPTPRRGLSVAGPVPHNPSSSNVNSDELTRQLEALNENNVQHKNDSLVSPCSPTSSTGVWSTSSLIRSNAITDRVTSIKYPVSPLSPLPRSPSPPPSTPTLDGRLFRLPRIETPMQQQHSQSRPRLELPSHTQYSHSSVQELDCGKELVVESSASAGRLGRPFSTPHWEGNKSQAPTNIPRIIVDHAANAPEVAVLPSTGPGTTELLDHRPQMPPQRLYTARPLKRQSPFVALTTTVLEAALSGILKSTEFLRHQLGPEPPVPSGHVRVRWTCTCGEDVYDDYIENRPGAAVDLEAHLNRVPHYWSNSPSSRHPYAAGSPVTYGSGSNSPLSNAGSPIFSEGGNPSPLSSASSWSSQGSNSPMLWDKSLSRQPTRVATNNPYTVNLKPYIEPLWLYTCVNEGRWTTKMRHLDVNTSKINSDKDLALSLGALHTQVNRGKWYKLFKLRGLVNIKFVQFELHRNRYADVSRSPAVPDLQTGEGSTYEYSPTELNPPVGSNYLMHLFKHPEDYDDELITYFRTPKRRDRLEIGTGWGLELVEGFLAERVWGAIAGLFLVGSLVFAIVWATRRGGDVQGAFGVAGWLVTVAGLVIAWAQAVVD